MPGPQRFRVRHVRRTTRLDRSGAARCVSRCRACATPVVVRIAPVDRRTVATHLQKARLTCEFPTHHIAPIVPQPILDGPCEPLCRPRDRCTARGGLPRDTMHGGVAVSSTPLRRRLALTECDTQQLATLIANMVKDHLRVTASEEPPFSFAQEVRHDRQDHRSTLAEDGLCLHSSVEHGTSTEPSREYGTTVCAAGPSTRLRLAPQSHSSTRR